MLRLFYFSGTRNARSVAHSLASEWQEHGRDAQVADPTQIDARGARLVPDDAAAYHATGAERPD